MYEPTLRSGDILPDEDGNSRWTVLQVSRWAVVAADRALPVAWRWSRPYGQGGIRLERARPEDTERHDCEWEARNLTEVAIPPQVRQYFRRSGEEIEELARDERMRLKRRAEDNLSEVVEGAVRRVQLRQLNQALQTRNMLLERRIRTLEARAWGERWVRGFCEKHGLNQIKLGRFLASLLDHLTEADVEKLRGTDPAPWDMSPILKRMPG